ncbi:MAG: polyprenol monophosphomannose synthase [Saprospiraceae bacterium]|nr:polyprenol monophosphomannose synthase [Saprospiraceae bacterium]
MSALVIIPTYNERENIAAIVQAVFALTEPFHILIVDDGSPDGTGQIVRDLKGGAHAERLHLLERSGKLGLGTAYIAGFRWGLQRGYNYVIEMDADFSHNPQDLPRLLAECHDAGADVAVGSRYCRGGQVENWPWERHFYSRGGSIYTRLMTLMPISDPTAGFVCWRRKVLDTINLDKIRFVGYAFQIEMKFAAWELGFKIREVPITFKDRELGVSKMSLKIVREGIFGVLQMRWRGFFDSYAKQG